MIEKILQASASTLIVAFIVWIISQIVIRFVLPKELKTRLDLLESKFDGFIKRYDEGSERNKSSQVAMFTMQDIQFDAMKSTNGAIREIAKSSCNGNKSDAIRLCDESDRDINAGKEIHRKASIGA